LSVPIRRRQLAKIDIAAAHRILEKRRGFYGDRR
jgi:hypothetical protein